MVNQLKKRAWVVVVFLLMVVLLPDVADAYRRGRCRCRNWTPRQIDSTADVSGVIIMDVDTTIDIGGHKGQIGIVTSHNLTWTDGPWGDLHISYDNANPAPPCTLLSEGSGSELFPAYQTVYLNWTMTADSFPGMTLRTIEPVEVVSQALWAWPTDSMVYYAVTDVYWEDAANPGDTVLYWAMAGTQGIISHMDVIPTLSEWGMIIFCALLFGWMAWMVVRRRKKVTVRM